MTTLIEQRAGRKEWLGLAVLMLPVLLVSIDNTVLSFALPYIALDLQPSAAMQLWIIDIYPLVLAGLLVTMGSFGDRIGRRKLLLIGSTGFALVSVLAAFSVSAEMLLISRLLLGFFGAMIMPCTLSLLRGMFHDRAQRRLAIAVWATGFSAGTAIGPIVGGVLLEHFHWGSVFLIAVPFLLPLLIFAPLLVTESRDPNPGPIDVPAILLSMAALAPIVFAIKHTATDGIDLISVGALLVGVLSGWLFVRRLLKQENPILDMRLFAVPAFTGSVLVNLVSVVALVGLLFFLSQHLQLILGLTPLQAGLMLLPGTVTMIVAGLLIVRVVRRVKVHIAMAFGLGLAFLAYLSLAITGGSAPLWMLVAAFTLLAAGIAIAETLSNDVIIASVPPAKAGAASAVSETAYEVGAVLGTSVLGGVLTASYRSGMVVPEGATAEQAHAARETLAGAVNVSNELEAGGMTAQAQTLLDSAFHAFDAGSTVTSAVGAVLMVGAIILALRMVGKATA